MSEPGYRLLRREVRPLTRTTAMYMQALPAFGGDRPLQKVRLEELRRIVREGRFRSPQWAVAVVEDEDGRVFRVNGNHSSKVLVEEEGWESQDADVSIEVFGCRDMAALAELWQTYDPPWSNRTPGECLRAVSHDIDGLSETPKAYIQLCLSGVRWDPGAGKAPFRSSVSRDLVAEHRPYIMWACETGLIKHRDPKRVPVLHAMWRTWQVCPATAKVFWDHVRLNDGENGCPTRLLRDLLREQFGMPRSLTSGVAVSLYVKAITAWDAFVCGRPLTVLRFNHQSWIDKKGRLLPEKKLPKPAKLPALSVAV